MLFCLIILIEKSFYNAESSMIPVLRKVAQLNIKYKKNGGPIIDVCTGALPDKVMAVLQPYSTIGSTNQKILKVRIGVGRF